MSDDNEPDEYKEIIEDINNNLKDFDTDEVYKYITTHMNDELKELMKTYEDKRNTFKPDELKSIHKAFKVLGIIQNVTIEEE
jgi:hypothetical protein